MTIWPFDGSIPCESNRQSLNRPNPESSNPVGLPFLAHRPLRRLPALPRRTDVRADGPAAARRRAGGLEHVPGLLSAGAAGRLPVCARRGAAADAAADRSAGGPAAGSRRVAAHHRARRRLRRLRRIRSGGSSGSCCSRSVCLSWSSRRPARCCSDGTRCSDPKLHARCTRCLRPATSAASLRFLAIRSWSNRRCAFGCRASRGRWATVSTRC